MTLEDFSLLNIKNANEDFLLSSLLPGKAWYLQEDKLTFYENDVVADEDFDLEFVVRKRSRQEYPGIILVNGNLTLNGRLNLEGIYALVVLGNLTCRVFEPESCDIYVRGDLNVAELLVAQSEDDMVAGEQIGLDRLAVHGLIDCPRIYTWYYRLFHLRLSPKSTEIITDALPNYERGIDTRELAEKLGIAI